MFDIVLYCIVKLQRDKNVIVVDSELVKWLMNTFIFHIHANYCLQLITNEKMETLYM